MWRSLTCLLLGWLLWLPTGAVAGAKAGQVSGADYLLSLLVAGALLGLMWPGHHLATGAWLVLPGAATFAAQLATIVVEDAMWWVLTLGLGVYVAAGAHRLGTEVRHLAGNVYRHRPRRPPPVDGPDPDRP